MTPTREEVRDALERIVYSSNPDVAFELAWSLHDIAERALALIDEGLADKQRLDWIDNAVAMGGTVSFGFCTDEDDEEGNRLTVTNEAVRSEEVSVEEYLTGVRNLIDEARGRDAATKGQGGDTGATAACQAHGQEGRRGGAHDPS